MAAAIGIEGVSKRYRVTRVAERVHYHTLRDDLAALAAWPLRRLRGQVPPRADDFWALQDVSFEVQPGEVVGVIGRNGAGKSTLLKVLSRITKPTAGHVRLRGRVGSLLEVGTGFHPELTGRENISLSGAVLGMRRAEIRRRFDEIVAFAEVERFLDTPVKRYSSGMFMRLAFAVMAHLEPEILLVDEVLAVGDAAFQKKCLGKMGEVARGGRTVLFVSHNLTAVTSLCSRAVWIDAGRVAADGPAAKVLRDYTHDSAGPSSEKVWGDPATAPYGEGVSLRRVAVCVAGQDAPAPATTSDDLDIVVDGHVAAARLLLNLSVHVRVEDGTIAFVTTSPPAVEEAGAVSWSVRIPANLLNGRSYTVSVYVVKDTNTVIVEAPLATQICVTEVREGNWFGKWEGIVKPALTWRVPRQPRSEESAKTDASRSELRSPAGVGS